VKHPLSLVWDLDSIFPGGSESQAFQAFLDALAADLETAKGRLEAAEPARRVADAAALAELVALLESLSSRLRQAGAFATCLVSQDTEDRKAPVLQARVRQMGASLAALWTQLDERLLAIDDALWRELLKAPGLAEVADALDERRRWAAKKLAPKVEALVSDLAVDGYHAWGELYNYVAGAIRIPFEKDGQLQHLSAGQVQNRMSSDPDRSVRAQLFAGYEKAWAENAELCARALNHLGGFRLALYRQRGWQSILEEPLEYNRISQETLDAMWQAVDEGKPLLVEYLHRKARLMGIERLSFYDVDAPLGDVKSVWTYDEAAAFIVAQFDRYSKRMGDFARQAFERRWIEAEDRPGKRAGGFCAAFPESHESRIFLTFDNSINSATTVAHELGHAFHHSVFRGVRYLMTDYPMNLAETASTLAELIVAEAGLETAKDAAERLALLDNKVRKTVAFFMNIHARFLFELAFYEARREGFVPVERLNALMEQAQKEAFCGALDQWHPLFWASKLHFYITGVPFYNFPYTFGYLFSHGVYQWAKEERASFEQRYEALLRDTGYMRTEELARKHFGVDLTGLDFWRGAVSQALEGVRAFLHETEGMAAAAST